MADTTCKVCSFKFTDESGVRTPKILTECKHTVCLECAKKLINDGKIECPFDRIVTNVPEADAKNLRKNFAILEMIDEEMWKRRHEASAVGPSEVNQEDENDEYWKERALRIPCAEDKTHFAVFYCGDCEADFCKKCSKVVHSLNCFSKHNLVRLTQKPEPKPTCSVHPSEIASLICKQLECRNELLCDTCGAKGSHVNHPKITILENSEKAKAKIRESLEIAKLKESTCLKHINDIEEKMDSYSPLTSKNFFEKQEEIKTYFRDLHNQLYTMENEWMNELSENAKKKYESFQKVKETYEVSLSKLKSQQKVMLEILRKKDIELITVEKDLNEMADSVKSTSISDPKGLDSLAWFCLRLPTVKMEFGIDRLYNFYQFGPPGCGENEIFKMIKKELKPCPTESSEYTAYIYNNRCIRLWNKYEHGPDELEVIFFTIPSPPPSLDVLINSWEEMKAVIPAGKKVFFPQWTDYSGEVRMRIVKLREKYQQATCLYWDQYDGLYHISQLMSYL